MQIYVDPQFPLQSLENVSWQLGMLIDLLAVVGPTGVDLSEGGAVGMCELLRACRDAVTEVSQLAAAGAMECRA